MGENRGITGSGKHRTVKEATRVHDKRICRVKHAGVPPDTGDLNGDDGELPLYPVSSNRHRLGAKSESHTASNPQPSSKVGHSMSDFNGEVSIRVGETAGWPLGRQEIAAWASSFLFPLDSQCSDSLQTMLQRDAHSCRETNTKKIDKCRILAENPGGSPPSERNGTVESFGVQSGHLKSPRQLKKLLDSTESVALLSAPANDEQGCDAQLGDRLNKLQVEACKKIVLRVAPSSGRGEILRRLKDLKAHPSSPRLVEESAGKYHKENTRKAAGKDDQRLKTSQPTSSNGIIKSSPTSVNKKHPIPSQFQSKAEENALGELEITFNLGEKRLQGNSSSDHRGSPRRCAEFSLENLSTPTSRLNNGSIQEQVVAVRKHAQRPKATNVSNSSPDHTPSVLAAVPFKWEEEPGIPKTIADAADRMLARRVSRESIEVSNFAEAQSGSHKSEEKPSTEVTEDGIPRRGTAHIRSSSTQSSPGTGKLDAGRTGSHRYYGEAYLRGNLRNAGFERSSRRYSIHGGDTYIDFDGSAAARFLVKAFESPWSTPSMHNGSPAFSVPFEWEDAPGKAKVEIVARSPNLLQLPPRLAVSSYCSAESFSRELRASHPFAGFFAPCIQTSSPAHRKRGERTLLKHASSKKLPPRAPGSAERRKRHGLVGRCSSTPREGCQIKMSKSCSQQSFKEKTSSFSSSDMSLIDPLPSTNSTTLNRRNLFSSEDKYSASCIQNSHLNAPSSPTSILCGPDESSAQTSASNIMFSSRDFEDFGNCSRQSVSKSSASASYGSIQEDLSEYSSPMNSMTHHPDPQVSDEPPLTLIPALAPTAVDISAREHDGHRSKGASNDVGSLLKLSKTGKYTSKFRSSQLKGTAHCPEATLVNYFQSLELNEASAQIRRKASTSALVEETGLLDKQGGSTSSGYVSSEGEAIVLKNSPTMQSVGKEEPANLVVQRRKGSGTPRKALTKSAPPKLPRRVRFTVSVCGSRFKELSLC